MAYKQRQEISVDELNEMQRYLGEETIEDYQAGQMSRRRMLRRLILICGASGATALLVACGDATATTTAPTTTASAAPAASATTAAATSAAATSAAPTNAASTTGPATSAAATSAAPTTVDGTTAARTTPAAGTTSAGTTAAGSTPGASKSPLSVAANDPEIVASDVTYPGDTTIFGYLVKPAASGTYPGVIVIHENRGLTDHIKDVARRFAKAGFIALAPDLASRNGGTARVPEDQVAGYFANANPGDLIKDLNSTEAYLETVQGVKTGKYGTVGFCFGGGMTLRFVAQNPKIAAAVPYYGPVPTPVSIMANTQAAILGIYGGNDTRVNAGIPDLENTLKAAGKTYQKIIYDGANHAFNNDTGASYNENASNKAWAATLDWLKKYL